MKLRRSGRRRATKAGDQVSTVVLHVEIKEVVIDLHAISNELNGVTCREVVVVDVIGDAAFGDVSASMFRNGDDAVKDVVVDLETVGAFERKFDREIHTDGIVMNEYTPSPAPLDPVVTVLPARLGPGDAVVSDLAVGHPGDEHRTAGDPSVRPRDASALPLPTRIDELAVVDLCPTREERSHATVEHVLNSEVVNMEILVTGAKNGAVQMRPAKRHSRDSDVRRLVLQTDKVGVRVDPIHVDLGVRKFLGGWFPIGGVSDNGLVHPGAFQSHPVFRFERGVEFVRPLRNVDGRSCGLFTDGSNEFLRVANDNIAKGVVGKQYKNEDRGCDCKKVWFQSLHVVPLWQSVRDYSNPNSNSLGQCGAQLGWKLGLRPSAAERPMGSSMSGPRV